MVFKFTGVYYTILLATGINTTIAVSVTYLCINSRLYLLASQTSVISSKADENRELVIDLVIGIGLPMVVMALCLSYTSLAYPYSAFSIQDARFITVDYGCYTPALPTWVFLIIIPICTVISCLPWLQTILLNLPGARCRMASRYANWIRYGIESIIVYVAFVFFAIFGFTQESRNNYRATLHFADQVFVKNCPRNKADGCVTSFFFSDFCLIYIDTLICFLESYSINPRCMPVKIVLFRSEDDLTRFVVLGCYGNIPQQTL